MVRRALSLLIALGYVAGQLAAAPHVHADDVCHEHHATRPHVHLGGFANGHHQCEHRHDTAHQHQPAASGGEHDHDEDAVYLQPVVARTPNVDLCRGDLVKGPPRAPWLLPALATPRVSGALSFAWCESRTYSTGGHCALFQTLQTLRI